MPEVTDKSNKLKMQDDIKKIVFNPCAYSMADIREMLATGKVSREELKRFFGDEITSSILGMAETTLPKGDRKGGNVKMADATQVVLWGAGGVGKTMVIASLLSLDGMKVKYADAPSVMSRIKHMTGLFKKEGVLQHVPHDGSGQKNIYNVVYRKNWWGKAYPITFIEATIPSDVPNNDTIDITKYVNKERNQIHVFCIDCRQNVQIQIDKLVKVIDELKRLDFLGLTDGAYALVTKTDLMNVPEAYMDNAAQTLVTKEMPSLWRKILDICYDNQIYNALPIPFRVGKFVVRDLAYLHAGDAEAFLHEALLPKCQPRRGFVGKMLSVGKWWQAAILGVLLACAIGWGGWKTFEMLTAPPTAPMLPYDYRTAFLKEERGLGKQNYKEAYQTYKRLRRDLDVERSLHTVNLEVVLPAEDLRICDSTLTNDFAKVLSAKCNRLLESSHWSDDVETLQELRSRLSDLLSHEKVLEGRDIQAYKTYIDDYFEYVRPLLKRSKACMKIRDVDYVENNYQKWRKYPYTNDLDLRGDIGNAERNAYESCAQFYSDRVDSIIRRYPTDREFDFESFGFTDRNEDIRRDKLDPYYNSVDSLMRRLDGKSESFNTARRILREAKNVIENNY